jgi:hypothetical protein
VTILIDMKGYPGERRHESPCTGLDLKSYLRRIPRGMALARRSRIWVHQPAIRGPLRLYDVPQPGEVIVLHEAEYSIAPALGQRGFRSDAEVRASMVYVAQASLNAAARDRKPVVASIGRPAALDAAEQARELLSRVVIAKPPREQT